MSYCLTHQHFYYVKEGCLECNDEKEEKKRSLYQVVEQEKYEWEHAKCKRCNKSAWYHFRRKTDEICEDCLEKERKSVVLLKIRRLIERSMKNKMSDLRNHLFETLEGVKDGEIKLEKARAICEIAQIIINTAKVEVEFIKAIGAKGSQFFDGKIESEQRIEFKEAV